ncbi:hypothetical protein SCLCIDRAFT_630077 [Scleroderma citrinum Foug A]|uniref:Uncharacterized protein n=1 Tax=Scleroderma citrinum Foug A TaxID=1036808 RepID=A0A0C3AHJ6_9AGAM|nr:hypothetical protein SCLCIDRAFT_630077 [Scleroderma citrinum Foug A]
MWHGDDRPFIHNITINNTTPPLKKILIRICSQTEEIFRPCRLWRKTPTVPSITCGSSKASLVDFASIVGAWMELHHIRSCAETARTYSVRFGRGANGPLLRWGISIDLSERRSNYAVHLRSADMTALGGATLYENIDKLEASFMTNSTTCCNSMTFERQLEYASLRNISSTSWVASRLGSLYIW